jgi:Flp pilus assembly protein TadB
MVGAVCAAFACFAVLQAFVRSGSNELSGDLIRLSTLSPVEWRLHREASATWYQRWIRPMVLFWSQRLRLRPAQMDPNFLAQAGLDSEQFDAIELRTIRVMAAVAGVTLGVLLGMLVTGTVTIAPLLGWIGYIAPMRVLALRRRQRQAAVLRDLPEFIGLLRAFLAVGMSLERTLHALSTNGGQDTVLKSEIRRALGRYGLGLRIEEALEELGPRTGVDELEGFVTALNQTRRAGNGLDAMLRDQELMVRMTHRNRITAQAGAVSTKLLGVLAGIYLPEFVILIVIPLFWGIMQRAFG